MDSVVNVQGGCGLAMGKKNQEIFEQARLEFNRSVGASEAEREQSLEDRAFYSVSGAQWGGAFGEAFSNKAKLEFNKINREVYRVINEWRNNRITVDFIPKDGTDDDLSDLCDGLFRADEQDSLASEAYDIAFEEGVAGGFGAFRFISEYEDEYSEDDERQRIRIEPLPDADQRVFFDVNARRYDKSDAKHCFVLTPYSRQSFEEEFDEDPSDWGSPISNDDSYVWFDGGDKVNVAEYYKVVEDKYQVLIFKDILGNTITRPKDDVTEDELARFESVNTSQIGEKTVKRRRVRKYILSGGGLLDDCGFIAGKYIPIVPFYGKRSFLDGVERWSGVVRYSKDAQRLYNMQVSYLSDVAARGGYRKPIFAPEQVQGHEQTWADDAEKNYSYLLVNPLEASDGSRVFQGALDYTNPPEVPPTIAALIQIVGQDIRDILGNQEAGEENEVNLSGKAIELIQTRLDQQSIIYMSNFATSLACAGKIWLSMASELYTEKERRMKVVGRQEDVGTVTLNKDKNFDAEGEIVAKNDLSRAAMDISADIGASSSSKRSATVRTLSSLLQLMSDPVDQKVISSLIITNLEGEGIQDTRNYFRKQLVQMGAVELTEEEQRDAALAQQSQQPSAQDQYLLAEAENSQADAEKARAQTVESMARAEKAKADAAKALSEIENKQRDSVVDAVTKLSEADTTPLPDRIGVRAGE